MWKLYDQYGQCIANATWPPMKLQSIRPDLTYMVASKHVASTTWNLCTSSDLVSNKTPHHLCNPIQMVIETRGLCHGPHPTSNWYCYLYVAPAGIETKHGDRKSHVLKLLKNLYGQKQAGWVWNEFFTNKLFALGFEQLKVDECVFYWGSVIFIVDVDDGMLLGKSECQLSSIVNEQDVGLDIDDQSIQWTMLVSAFKSMMMGLMSSYNVPSLIPSSKM